MFVWIQSGLDFGGNNIEIILVVNCYCVWIFFMMIRLLLLCREVYKEVRLGIK